MSDLGSKGNANSSPIHGIGITSDMLTSRGGLSIFVRYLINLELLPLLGAAFSGIRKSAKGTSVDEIFKQIFCFFADGTSFHVIRFDALKKDPGYAGVLHSDHEDLMSSHSVKRFYRAFHWGMSGVYRKFLLRLFLWRLKICRPRLIELGIDTMVMNNDEARKREGVQKTYKKVKGFQPLQMTWGRFVIDALFRGGKKHGNSGNEVAKMVKRMVKAIRRGYCSDVPIVIRLDSGFSDQKLFRLFDELGVGFTCSGKKYKKIEEFVDQCGKDFWRCYENGNRAWDYLEFGYAPAEKARFYRAILTQLDDGDDQLLLRFARMESLIYTNLGMGGSIDTRLKERDLHHLLEPTGVIRMHHGRGADELVHRGIKEFGPEALPFQRFAYNAGFYYTMVLAFFVFECFKEDVCSEVVPVTSYPNTVRRNIIDFAAKIVRSGRRTILKVTASAWTQLNLGRIWDKSGHSPEFSSA